MSNVTRAIEILNANGYQAEQSAVNYAVVVVQDPTHCRNGLRFWIEYEPRNLPVLADLIAVFRFIEERR